MAAILSPSMLAYEDDFLLIIDKPAGMLVHPTVSERGTTLYDYVKAYYEANGINAGIARARDYAGKLFAFLVIVGQIHSANNFLPH